MTDETETPQEESTSQSAEDSRFEVKWKKRGGGEAPASEPRASDDVTDPTELERQLESERSRVKDLEERWHRAAADLVNLRRRTEQERGDLEKFAGMLLVQEILPVLDNFERALATIPGNLQMLTWIQGVMLIERHLQAILERQGLSPIEAMGQPFNAHLHEAIAERQTDEAPAGTILQEYQKGYTMHGRVIRPSLVEVASAPAATTEEREAEQRRPDNEAESTDEEQGREIADEAEKENVGP